MKQVYFIGIGGIGMSALARYFHAKGYRVSGYDLTPSPLIEALISEGIQVTFDDAVDAIVPQIPKREETTVVYTPAVPSSHPQLRYFIEQGYRVVKRAEILGDITRMEKALCVAGTHGKTTTSTILAHLLKQSHVDCNAFLGGIANNYKTNLLLSEKSDLVVVEADEFDRSFHHLTPALAIITAADPDHLDIYGTPEAYREAFEHFTALIRPGGYLIMKKGIAISPRTKPGVTSLTYAVNEPADFYATDIDTENGELTFRWHYPDDNGTPLAVKLGVPLYINVENATAAMAAAYLNGVNILELQSGIASFAGSHRRFDRVLNTERFVLIDDYAHHPEELQASLNSVRKLYPNERILGIFQPHLYSRTADFYREFASALDLIDQTILIDIYPAREEPMPGVTSQLIADHMSRKPMAVLPREELTVFLSRHLKELPRIIIMLGAGNIDRLVLPVKELLVENIK
ncbi:UDP-N-acetylmuramate--alanine ligase [Porphyromonas macacae]|uniref:UDP-N-acetylmuramate--L-alanine ligase n=1 Tax=Porphyromonas macacae TaxID=28115 RepID=UPI00052CF550|nr:UDP-N-acetylmuramate--L-alanine ligase [Porphyromonas macacae]KGN99486.1 UDP-N-acetylmuramate--alanine ligase [Porphyromonas macacae]